MLSFLKKYFQRKSDNTLVEDKSMSEVQRTEKNESLDEIIERWRWNHVELNKGAPEEIIARVQKQLNFNLPKISSVFTSR